MRGSEEQARGLLLTALTLMPLSDVLVHIDTQQINTIIPQMPAQTALAAAAAGGRVVLVGMGQTEMSLPIGSASIREVDILGCFRYRNTVSCLGSVGVFVSFEVYAALCYGRSLLLTCRMQNAPESKTPSDPLSPTPISTQRASSSSPQGESSWDP